MKRKTLIKIMVINLTITAICVLIAGICIISSVNPRSIIAILIFGMLSQTFAVMCIDRAYDSLEKEYEASNSHYIDMC